jgi:hypothetical protein
MGSGRRKVCFLKTEGESRPYRCIIWGYLGLLIGGSMGSFDINGLVKALCYLGVEVPPLSRTGLRL